MGDSNHRVTILVAVIGVVGTLGAAVLANWNKIFGHAAPAGPAPATATPADLPRNAPVLSGNWRDSGGAQVTSRITQAGTNLQFSRQGSLPGGVTFTAAGSGTLHGQQVVSSYEARYSHGAVSSGTCTGSVSADATRIDMRCRDTLLGEFTSVSTRE